jgi:molecular chaperone Hsp33
MGAGLMAAFLKGTDRLKLQIECSGPVKGVTVEANAYGEVRGYLHKNPIPISQAVDSFSLAPFLGAGVLTVTRYLEGAERPLEGKAILQYGDIAKDLAHYYLTSEQIPTAVNLGLQFDPQGDVIGAGGFILQALPAATDQQITEIEALVPSMPSLGKYFAGQGEPPKLVKHHFRQYAPEFLKERRVEFMCHCNAHSISSLLTYLPVDELDELRRQGQFPVEIRCHFCNTAYHFDQVAIEQVYTLRRSDS